VRRFELGLYHNAGQLLLKVLDRAPGDADAAHYLRLVNRRLGPRPATKPVLIWQFKPDGAWEADWLRWLVADVVGGEIIDNTWTRMHDPMIVVDNRLVPEKLSYYREAFEQGRRVVLIHLSDEAFKEDYDAYRYCDAVLRNCFSERLADIASVRHFPLGFKAGFVRIGQAPKPSAARKYLWSFAGDTKKITRGEMLAEMGRLPRGFTHLTCGFGTPDALPTADYRALMDDTVFVPCPGGWSNLDTFRTYEALEAGCIPIVERRPGFEYYTRLLGTHPMPAVHDWREGADVVRRLESEGSTERLRAACERWWSDYKTKLKADTVSFISAALA
jgi:hypothetical protein